METREAMVIGNIRKKYDFKKFFFQWEWMLVLIFIILNIYNASITEYYLDMNNLLDATMSFLDKSFMVLPMVYIIVLGEIDISVGSTLALSSVVMGVLFSKGVPMPAAIIACLLTGTACGMINGLLVTRFKELSSTILTLSTMIIFRGFAYTILQDQSVGNFPKWFSYLGWGKIGEIPFILIVFLVFALMFGIILHKTVFGRRVYAMGNNVTASEFSGIKVNKIKVLIFALGGLMAAVSAIFLTSKMGSTRPNIASGYELEVIAMVVLGGISTAGGKGRMIGAVISIFIIGFLRYGLGLANVTSQILIIITGLLLIFAVMVPNLKLNTWKKKKT